MYCHNNLYDIININFAYDDEINNQLNKYIIGDAFSTYKNCNRLNLTTVNQDDYIVIQSKEYFILPQTKTKKITLSVIFNNLDDTTGFTSRVGIFDDTNDKTVDTGGNGIFFELKDNNFYIVMRYGETNQTDIRIHQNCFSMDKLNGNGRSKYMLNSFNKLLTFIIEFENVLRDSIRFYILINNVPCLFHEIKFCNNLLACFKSNLFPIRFSLEKTGNNENIATLTQGPLSIQINGEYKLYKQLKYHMIHDNLQKLCNKKDLSISYFSIKLKDNYNRAVIRNFEPYIYIKGSILDLIIIQVYKNPTFENELIWENKSNSMIQYSTTQTTINKDNAELITIMYMDSQNKIYNMNNKISDNNILTSNIQGESDIFTVIITNMNTSTGKIHSSFNWIETR